MVKGMKVSKCVEGIARQIVKMNLSSKVGPNFEMETRKLCMKNLGNKHKSIKKFRFDDGSRLFSHIKLAKINKGILSKKLDMYRNAKIKIENENCTNSDGNLKKNSECNKSVIDYGNPKIFMDYMDRKMANKMFKLGKKANYILIKDTMINKCKRAFKKDNPNCYEKGRFKESLCPDIAPKSCIKKSLLEFSKLYKIKRCLKKWKKLAPKAFGKTLNPKKIYMEMGIMGLCSGNKEERRKFEENVDKRNEEIEAKQAAKKAKLDERYEKKERKREERIAARNERMEKKKEMKLLKSSAKILDNLLKPNKPKKEKIIKNKNPDTNPLTADQMAKARTFAASVVNNDIPKEKKKEIINEVINEVINAPNIEKLKQRRRIRFKINREIKNNSKTLNKLKNRYGDKMNSGKKSIINPKVIRIGKLLGKLKPKYEDNNANKINNDLLEIKRKNAAKKLVLNVRNFLNKKSKPKHEGMEIDEGIGDNVNEKILEIKKKNAAKKLVFNVKKFLDKKSKLGDGGIREKLRLIDERNDKFFSDPKYENEHNKLAIGKKWNGDQKGISKSKLASLKDKINEILYIYKRVRGKLLKKLKESNEENKMEILTQMAYERYRKIKKWGEINEKIDEIEKENNKGLKIIM